MHVPLTDIQDAKAEEVGGAKEKKRRNTTTNKMYVYWVQKLMY